jgi:ribonuclease HI
MENYNCVKIFSDGGSRGNPGNAASGIIIFDEKDKLLKINAKYLGEMTNNQAEYEALLTAIRMVQVMKVKKLKIYLDSELAVKQLKGEFKINNNIIKQKKKILDKLFKKFECVEIFHIERGYNKFADKLVNIVLDVYSLKE